MTEDITICQKKIRQLNKEIKLLNIELEVLGSDYKRILEFSKSLTSTLEIEEVMYNLLLFIDGVLNFDGGYMALLKVDGDKEVLEFDRQNEEIVMIQKDAEHILEDYDLIIANVKRENILLDNGSKLISIKKMKNGTIGVICLTSIEEGVFSNKELNLFSELVKYTYIAIENAVLFYQINEFATRDGLTGIYNRRYFFELIEYEAIRSKREKKNYSIVLFDIDFFKKVNDTHGHQKGDEVLKAISKLVGNQIRESDLYARYGGEEFILFFPDTEKDGAYLISEKIRKAIEMKGLAGLKVTASFGVSSRKARDILVEKVIVEADKALYNAKDAGRNCVKLFGGEDG